MASTQGHAQCQSIAQHCGYRQPPDMHLGFAVGHIPATTVHSTLFPGSLQACYYLVRKDICLQDGIWLPSLLCLFNLMQ